MKLWLQHLTRTTSAALINNNSIVHATDANSTSSSINRKRQASNEGRDLEIIIKPRPQTAVNSPTEKRDNKAAAAVS
jgi:hypothetical protein